MQQLKINLPYPLYSAPDPQMAGEYDNTRVYWMGPDYEISKSTKRTALIKDGLNDRWMLTVTPDELGYWNLFIGKGDPSDMTNLGYQERFECVLATDRECQLGLQNSYHAGVVDVYPSNGVNTTYSNVPTATGVTYAYASQRDMVATMDGYIYGIKMYTPAGISTATLTTLKFFTMDGSFNVRGISNDIKATAWVVGGWTTVTFTKPVLVRAGDGWGFEVANASGGDLNAFALVECTDAACQMMRRLTNALSLSAANAGFASWATGDGKMPAVKMMMHPPSIAIAGNSIWAGHPGSYTVWEIGKTAAMYYTRANDPAAILQDLLGVTCVSCGDGGTKLADWVGVTGLWKTVIEPLHPACVIFDTVYNEAGDGVTNEAYMKLAERIIARACKDRIKLRFIEAPVTAGALAGGFAGRIEALNGVTATLCKLHGLRYIPTYYRVGEPTDDVWLGRYRRQQKDISALDTDILDYGEAGANPVHLSVPGLIPAMMAAADSFVSGGMIEARG